MTLHIDFNVFEERGLFKTTFGAMAYAFITLMTITSFDRTRNFFGKNNWKPIHTIGGYLIWVIFAKSYLLDLSSPIRIFLALIAVSVLVLRISVLFKRKR
jgi:DMSO/TMAO reductase YedYZ heme-binding membrane subunit